MHRRTALSLLGGSLAVGLAGCFGGDDDDTDGGDDDDTDGGNDDNGGPLVTGEFRAESTGGFIALNEETEADARENGFDLPPTEDIENPVVVEGAVENGTWESTAVEFPDPDLEAVLDDPGDLEPFIDDIDLGIAAPNGFSGELDHDEEYMTLIGLLVLRIFIDGGDNDGNPQFEIDIELNGTTRQSGDLTGTFDNTPPNLTVTVVDNDVAVDEIDDGFIGPIINNELGLPSEPGETWGEIEFVFEDL